MPFIITAAPVDTLKLDTMNLNALPTAAQPKVKEAVSEVVEEEIESEDLKLILFPSQIQKVSSLITVIAQQREKLTVLQDELDKLSQKALLSETLAWRAQFHYNFDEDTHDVHVKVCIHGDSILGAVM